MLDKTMISQWRKENRKNRELEKAAREGTLQVNICYINICLKYQK